MWYVIGGLLGGIVIGYMLPLSFALLYGRYLSMAVLAALDASLGGLRAHYEGTFRQHIFVTGFFSNILLATFLTYVGDRLGVELYQAAVVAMGIRLFNNVGRIRRHLLAERERRAEGPSAGAAPAAAAPAATPSDPAP